MSGGISYSLTSAIRIALSPAVGVERNPPTFQQVPIARRWKNS